MVNPDAVVAVLVLKHRTNKQALAAASASTTRWSLVTCPWSLFFDLPISEAKIQLQQTRTSRDKLPSEALLTHEPGQCIGATARSHGPDANQAFQRGICSPLDPKLLRSRVRAKTRGTRCDW